MLDFEDGLSDRAILDKWDLRILAMHLSGAASNLEGEAVSGPVSYPETENFTDGEGNECIRQVHYSQLPSSVSRDFPATYLSLTKALQRVSDIGLSGDNALLSTEIESAVHAARGLLGASVERVRQLLAPHAAALRTLSRYGPWRNHRPDCR
jgi:hypothetical protein